MAVPQRSRHRLSAPQAAILDASVTAAGLQAFLAKRELIFERLLDQAQRRLGLSQIDFVHRGGQRVFRSGNWAIKLHALPGGRNAAHASAQRSVSAAHTLSNLALTLAPESRVENPLLLLEGAVTVWPWTNAVRPATWHDQGTLLNKLHDLDPSILAQAHLTNDIEQLGHTTEARLREVLYGVDRGAEAREIAARLLRAFVERRPQFAHMFKSEEQRILQVDASLGNIIVTVDGPRLIDLDHIATGPRLFDRLASTPVVQSNGETWTTRGDMDDLIRCYGHDPQLEPGFQTMLDFRRLAFATFELWRDPEHLDQYRLAEVSQAMDSFEPAEPGASLEHRSSALPA